MKCRVGTRTPGGTRGVSAKPVVELISAFRSLSRGYIGPAHERGWGQVSRNSRFCLCLCNCPVRLLKIVSKFEKKRNLHPVSDSVTPGFSCDPPPSPLSVPTQMLWGPVRAGCSRATAPAVRPSVLCKHLEAVQVGLSLKIGVHKPCLRWRLLFSS